MNRAPVAGLTAPVKLARNDRTDARAQLRQMHGAWRADVHRVWTGKLQPKELPWLKLDGKEETITDCKLLRTQIPDIALAHTNGIVALLAR